MKRTLIPISIKIFLLCALTLGSVGGVGAEGSGIPIAPKPAFTQINFNAYTPTPFGNEDVNPTMSIEENGNALRLQGNSWKKISLPYTVTANTVLEFDFQSSSQGEVHGIGFDNNETMSESYTFKLYGTQNWGIRNVPFYKYQTYAPETRHYQIRFGDHSAGLTGNMLYLVFVNDHDIANPTAQSYFSNVRVYEEDPNTPISPPVSVDFDNYVFSPYDGFSQSPDLTLTIDENGNSLQMNGNGWMKMSFPYLVTESTVIEFEFKSASQGQIHGIGFDDDNSQQSNRTVTLHGTQNWGMNAFRYALYEPDWKHYRIPVGKYYTGMMKYIFFANDHDVSSPTAESQFKNLNIYEGEVSLPLTVDFTQYAFSPYYSPQGGGAPPTISVEDNGSTLHLSGNGWTQISMPVNIMPETVLEFDFMSTSQGEIHAIGFDTNQSGDTTNTFKLYGTQGYGNTTFNNYTGSESQWKHYVIPIGQYISSGQQLYLFFANDHDVANPTAESYFSNVQIHVQTSSYLYDRVAAVSYANDWARDRNPNYPLSNETGCGCNDCTNYISQILHEGGYPLRVGHTWDADNKYEWWYRTNFFPYNSKTWSATDWFYQYTKIYDAEFDTNVQWSDLEGGDFILMDLRNNETPNINTPDGKPDHARVVIGEGDTSDNPIDYISYTSNHCAINYNPVPPVETTLLVNQHCVDRKHVVWDYGIDFSVHNLFYIHVID